MTWISIEERLPPSGYKNSCLVTDGKNISMAWLAKRTKYHLENSDVPWHEEAYYLMHDITGWPKVTHWMELPKLPEKRDQ